MSEQIAAPNPEKSNSVLRDRDFLIFWGSETASLMGGELTKLVFPLVAILTLSATAFQVGLIQAFMYAPIIIFSLFIGVWLDRRRRRASLIVSNLVRAGLVVLVPLAAITSLLSLPVLYLVVFLVGTLTVVFEVGSLSYVPTLVERHQLADANGRIQTSFSLAAIAGPAVGGVLVGAMTAPGALLISAAAFLLSAALLRTIRRVEPMPDVATVPAPTFPAIAEGLRTVFASAMLRNLLAQSSTFNFSQNALLVVFLVYVVRSLGLSPSQLGLVLGGGALAALLAALTGNRITGWLGLGRTLRVATYGCCLPGLLLLVPRDNGILAMSILITAQAIMAFHLVMWNINTLTIRQVVTPNQLLGRMNASYRMILFGVAPLGALLGGALGDLIGLRTSMVITALLLLTPIVWTFFSPVFRLTVMPTGPADEPRADSAAPTGERDTGDPDKASA